MSGALHVKYRPKLFKDVVGNEDQVAAFASAIKRKRTQTFLLVGPAGVGKTTLARIAATKLGCTETGLSEINAAKHTGVDDMREVENLTMYRPLGSTVRCIIIDECHMLSKSAWNSLLKVTEEPPEGVYWFFCTTEVSKVPETMRSRGLSLTLKRLPADEILAVVRRVVEKEGITLPEGVDELISRESNGSPRQALVYLEKVDGVADLDTAEERIKQVVDSDPVIALCRLMVVNKKRQWGEVTKILADIEASGTNPEGVRIIVCNYFAKVLRGCKTTQQALYYLDVLNAFKDPYTVSDNSAPLYISIGRVVA